MIERSGYIEYRPDRNHVYWLAFFYERRRTRVRIEAAHIYDRDHKFIGTWYAENMPHSLLHKWATQLRDMYPAGWSDPDDTTWLG